MTALPDTAPPKATLGDYLALTKPRLSLMSVLTALIGYVAARPPWIFLEFASLIVGTCLAAAGVAALNQWLEADTDARMRRTATRPIPTGKIPPGSAFVLGALLCTAALAVIFVNINGMAAIFTLLTIASYVGWYTPAKRRSRWSTEIGAIAGAFPPLIGWAAAEAGISPLGWILFGILALWQIPHFMAIAWVYRRDYSAVDFPMLAVRDESGNWTAAWSLINALALLGVSLLPWWLRLASGYYGAVAALSGLWFCWRAWRFLRPSDARSASAGAGNARELAARALFITSLLYLPVVLMGLLADRLLFF